MSGPLLIGCKRVFIITGVLTIFIHLGLGVGLRGKLYEPNICNAKYRKKNVENSGLFSMSGHLLIGCKRVFIK